MPFRETRAVQHERLQMGKVAHYYYTSPFGRSDVRDEVTCVNGC
jgi:hypothetical protein